jgi:hypothetical protein
MQPVLVAIGDVVEEIDRAGERAEDGEGAERRPQRGREEPLREYQPAEDEQVLDPLPRAQRDEEPEEHPATAE